jgi:hypothetical protein
MTVSLLFEIFAPKNALDNGCTKKHLDSKDAGGLYEPLPLIEAGVSDLSCIISH